MHLHICVCVFGSMKGLENVVTQLCLTLLSVALQLLLLSMGFSSRNTEGLLQGSLQLQELVLGLLELQADLTI